MNKLSEYILGTHRDELERLGFQHRVWAAEASRLWDQMGVSLGSYVLDLGCGPGFATFDLAEIVGRDGRLLGIDKSQEYIQYSETRAAALGVRHADFIRGDFNDVSIPRESQDFAYARWTFSWVKNVREVVDKVVASLRPGGRFGLQEYVNWTTFRVFPEYPAITRVIKACHASWDQMDSEINIGPQLVGDLVSSGMRIDHIDTLHKIGRPGDMTWQWPTTFFRIYSERLIELGLLTEKERAEFLNEWQQLEKQPDAFVVTPMMMEIIATKVP